MSVNSSKNIFQPLPTCDTCLINSLESNLSKVLAQDAVVLSDLKNPELSEREKEAAQICDHWQKIGACTVKFGIEVE